MLRYINSVCLILFFLISLGSCGINNDYSLDIVINKEVNNNFIYTIDEPGKVLLRWYLFAYGNECSISSSDVKCQILDLLKIKKECDHLHISSLKSWLSDNMLISYKLMDCPVLPSKGSIQNTISNIKLERRSNVISITIKASGLNTIEEKIWNIQQSESYTISNNKMLLIQ